MKATESVGHVFGRLTVVRLVEVNKNRCWIVACKCSCGNPVEKLAVFSHISQGSVRSCGCLHRETAKATAIASCTTHGKSGTPTYRVWARMKNRCYNKADARYADWGGRGIKVCARWRNSFENFLADMGEKPEGKSLERKKNHLGYSPSNCTWATPSEQGSNRRNSRLLKFRGKTQTLKAWAKAVGLERLTLHVRLKLGWSLEKALTTLVRIDSRNVGKHAGLITLGG